MLGRVALVESIDLAMRRMQQRHVAGQVLLGGIEEVGQQREMDMVVAVGEEAHLQVLHQRCDRARAAEHRRHHNQGAHVGRHASGVVEPRQGVGPDQPGGDPVDQRHRQLAVRDHAQAQRQPEPAAPVHGQRVAQGRPGEQRHHQRAGQRVRQQRQAAGGPAHAAGDAAQRQRVFKPGATLVDQVVADMGGELVASGLCRMRLGQLQHLHGDGVLGQPAAARDQLDGVPVIVARGEVHRPVGARGVLAQRGVHHAQGLDELAPVHHRQEAQAGDAVADRDLRRGLLLGLGLDHLFDALAAVGKPLLDPGQGQRQFRTPALQAPCELGDEGTASWRL